MSKIKPNTEGKVLVLYLNSQTKDYITPSQLAAFQNAGVGLKILSQPEVEVPEVLAKNTKTEDVPNGVTGAVID